MNTELLSAIEEKENAIATIEKSIESLNRTIKTLYDEIAGIKNEIAESIDIDSEIDNIIESVNGTIPSYSDLDDISYNLGSAQDIASDGADFFRELAYKLTKWRDDLPVELTDDDNYTLDSRIDDCNEVISMLDDFYSILQDAIDKAEQIRIKLEY